MVELPSPFDPNWLDTAKLPDGSGSCADQIARNYFNEHEGHIISAWSVPPPDHLDPARYEKHVQKTQTTLSLSILQSVLPIIESSPESLNGTSIHILQSLLRRALPLDDGTSERIKSLVQKVQSISSTKKQLTVGCAICGEQLIYVGRQSTKCVRDHTWKLCSITGIELTTTEKVCTNCDQLALGALDHESSISIGKAIYEAFEVCPYCGGRYYAFP